MNTRQQYKQARRFIRHAAKLYLQGDKSAAAMRHYRVSVNEMRSLTGWDLCFPAGSPLNAIGEAF